MVIETIIAFIVCWLIFVGGMLLYSLLTEKDLGIEYYGNEEFLYLEKGIRIRHDFDVVGVDLPLGCEFIKDGKTVVVHYALGCTGCAYSADRINKECKIRPLCLPQERIDNKSVIFKNKE